MGRSVRTPGLDTKRLESKLSHIDDNGWYNQDKLPDYTQEMVKLNQAVYDINQITITLSDKAGKTIATTSTSGLMSNTDKSKLDGIAANANNYSHPTGDGDLHVPATGTTNSGKVLTAGSTAGSLSWTDLPAVPVTSVAGRTGAITLTKTDVGLGNVDNTNDLNKPISTLVSAALSNKVDKISGKGLSTEDYTTTEKNKLASIQSNANLYTDVQAQDAINSALISGTHSGINFSYNDTNNSLSLTNTDTGSLAVINHINDPNPHPEYIKSINSLSGDSSGNVSLPIPSVSVARLDSTQVSASTTEQILNGFTFTIPPEKTATINCIMIFSAAATTTGAFLGVRVSNEAGANGDAVGSWQAYVNVTSAQANSGLADGDVLIVTPGTTTSAGRGVTGTASTAGNNSSSLLLLLSNTSTNANTQASIVFRSETTTAVTAQVGTIATCILS